MVRIVSCHRMKPPVETASGKRRRGHGLAFLQGRKRKGMRRKSRRSIALPAVLEEQEEGQIYHVGIPEECVQEARFLTAYLEAVLQEVSGDYLYLDVFLRKRVCVQEAGERLWRRYGILAQEEVLGQYWGRWLAQGQGKRCSRLAVCLNPEQFLQVREILFQLAEGRNEMTLFFSDAPGREESVAVAELVMDFAEDLSYEYGLVLRHGIPLRQFSLPESQSCGHGGKGGLLAVDLQEEVKFLIAMLDVCRNGPVCYLDGLPTPEKAKYADRRARPMFAYRSVGEMWSGEQCGEKWKWKGMPTIDTASKTGYNTMNENVHDGRNENHVTAVSFYNATCGWMEQQGILDRRKR